MNIRHQISHQALYRSEKLSDIAFRFIDGSCNEVKIPAHRLLLASQSPVFERMFCGDLVEGPSVVITDASAVAFAEFLQIFYSTEFNLSLSHMGEVFKLIDKYDVATVWPACEKYLIDSIQPDVAFLYYELALSFDLSEALIAELNAIICAHPIEVLRCGIEHSCNRLVLKTILQLDQLDCEEFVLLESVVDWTKATMARVGAASTDIESIRDEMGDCLDCIRFPVMTVDEMASCVERFPGLLTPEELHDVLQHIADGTELTVANRFSTMRRRVHDITVAFALSQSNTNIITDETKIHFKLTSYVPQRYTIAIEMIAVHDLRCDVMLLAYGRDRILYKDVHQLDGGHLSADHVTVCRLRTAVILSATDDQYLLRISFRRSGVEMEANMITQPMVDNDMISFVHTNPSFVTGLKFVAA